MPSREHEPSDTTANRLKEIRQACQQADSELSLAASQHYSAWGMDALGAFLHIHSCISGKVVKVHSASAEVLELNRLFVGRCLEVYRCFLKGDFSPESLSPTWVLIYEEYREAPRAYSKLLPLMAMAHILEDLEWALFYVEVKEDEYHAVFNYILDCVDRIRSSYRAEMDGNLKEMLLDLLCNELGRSIRDFTVQELRRMAWESAQRRRRMKPLLSSTLS